MTVLEMFVLNRAIDGQPIYGAPSFEDLRVSNIQIHGIKAALVQRGLLETADSFTAAGAREVRIMQEYKESLKYVVVESVIVGLSGRAATALRHSPLHGQYYFSRVDVEHAGEQLLNTYPFMAEFTRPPQHADDEPVDSTEIMPLLSNHVENAVNVRSRGTYASAYANITFYLQDEQLYRYDWFAHTRRRTWKNEVLHLLEGMFAV